MSTISMTKNRTVSRQSKAKKNTDTIVENVANAPPDTSALKLIRRQIMSSKDVIRVSRKKQFATFCVNVRMRGAVRPFI